MKKRIILSITFFLILAAGYSAYSKENAITKDTLLYVRDHRGENFLVLKVDECSLGSKGEVICAMEPVAGAKLIVAGPKGNFWDELSYPN